VQSVHILELACCPLHAWRSCSNMSVLAHFCALNQSSHLRRACLCIEAMPCQCRVNVFEGLLALLQLRNDNVTSPWRKCDSQKIAKVLEKAGMASQRTRNRAVLYDLARLFEKGTNKRLRSVDGCPSGGQNAKRVKKSRSLKVEATAEAKDVARKVHGAKNDGDRSPRLGKVPDTLPVAAEFTVERVQVGNSPGKENGHADDPSPENLGTQAHKKPGTGTKQGRNRKSAPDRLQGKHAEATTLATRRAESLSPGAGRALSKAVHLVEMATPEKRRIKFDLERNVVHQIGKPLPPAELRTPPSAKPRGSVLKKVSSLSREGGPRASRRRHSLSVVPSAKMVPPGQPFLTP
jgi:hypothetical protein